MTFIRVDPPWTTLHVGMIQGGTAHNITAADCRFSCEFRVVPGEDIEDWVAAFEGQVAQADLGEALELMWLTPKQALDALYRLQALQHPTESDTAP